MSDRELLEMAAKAAGFDVMPGVNGWCIRCDTMDSWNPLADDGDALRLAVKIGISKTLLLEVGCVGVDCEFQRGNDQASWSHDGDPYAATRRAIVLAAAEIGKAEP